MTVPPLGEPIPVRHAAGDYPVYVQYGLIERLGDLARWHLPARRPVVVADSTVAGLHGSRVRAVLRSGDEAGGEIPLLTFPAGEASKTRETWARLTDDLLALGLGGEAAIVALGGGVTGDLAGFVAATYHRGIPVLHVPTTLLAMVDSAIGGKTAVDAPAGKNLIGAYHHPAAVAADPGLLATLPDGEYRGGLAEAVKHGLMLDTEYFEWIEAEAALLGARDPERVTTLVRRSAHLKATVVTADERDRGGRTALNAGHTVAHAIERASGWTVPHGDAVAIGLVAEMTLAVQLGVLEPGVVRRVAALLRRFGLPVRVSEAAGDGVTPERIVDAARGDKKNRGGAPDLRFALPAGIGRTHRDGAEWTVGVAPAVVRKVIEARM
jgi:3-dehydroquinate synthase